MNDSRRVRTVLGLLLLVALALMTIDYRGGADSPLAPLRTAGSAAFGPIERGVDAVARPIGDTVSAIGDAPGAGRRIRDLKEQNQRLRERLNASALDSHKSAQLDKMLHLAGLGRYKVLAAQVVALGSGRGYERTVTIDTGRRDGVRQGMTVLNGAGLVGRVVFAGPTTATVLLASDASSSVGGRLEGSDEIGVVHGTGRTSAPALSFEVLDANAALKPGERIVTFGSENDRPFVPGVPVGTIERVEKTPGKLTRTATVRPFVAYGALDVVGVVVAPPNSDPRDAVLPPKPKPSATPSDTGPGATESPGASPSAGDTAGPGRTAGAAASPGATDGGGSTGTASPGGGH